MFFIHSQENVTSWDTLFISEEILGMNPGLHVHQSLKEIPFEILLPINPSFFHAPMPATPNVNVSVIKKGFPWILGYVWSHLFVHSSHHVYPLILFPLQHINATLPFKFSNNSPPFNQSINPIFEPLLPLPFVFLSNPLLLHSALLPSGN